MIIRKPPKGEPIPEALLIHKEKSLKGQIKKAERDLKRVTTRKNQLGKHVVERFQKYLDQQFTTLYQFTEYLETKDLDSISLKQKQPGYQDWGGFQ